jgi:hypothetical protein
MMFKLKVRTCCCIHHVPVFTSIRRLSLSPSYTCMMDKMGKGCVSYAVISYDPGSYWLSHNWYLTAPPAVALVTVEFSRSSRLAR